MVGSPPERRGEPPIGPLALYWSDYVAHCRRKGPEPDRRRAWLAGPRLLVNPGLKAVLLLRLANASPRVTWWVWRSLFVHLFAMDWSGSLRIGPGLELPHPVCVLLAGGARIGSDVGLAHNVTMAGGADDGLPVIGDRVTIYPGVVLIGGVTVGDDAVVGANTVVSRDVPPGHLATPRGTLPLAASRGHGHVPPG